MSDCTHRWRIETPNGQHLLRGECLKCGAERMYPCTDLGGDRFSAYPVIELSVRREAARMRVNNARARVADRGIRL